MCSNGRPSGARVFRAGTGPLHFACRVRRAPFSSVLPGVRWHRGAARFESAFFVMLLSLEYESNDSKGSENYYMRPVTTRNSENTTTHTRHTNTHTHTHTHTTLARFFPIMSVPAHAILASIIISIMAVAAISAASPAVVEGSAGAEGKLAPLHVRPANASQTTYPCYKATCAGTATCCHYGGADMCCWNGGGGIPGPVR